MKRTIAIVAALVAITPALTACPGDSKPTGSTSCLVYGRSANSNGGLVLDVRCSLPGGGIKRTTQFAPRAAMWPKCVNGAEWPDCKG